MNSVCAYVWGEGGERGAVQIVRQVSQGAKGGVQGGVRNVRGSDTAQPTG